MRNKFVTRLVPYLYILPAYIFFAVFVFYPIVFGFIASFSQWGFKIGESKGFVGLKNYSVLLKDPIFWQSFRNTWIYVPLVTILTSVVGLSLALICDRPLKAVRSLRGVAFIPYMFPWAAVAMIWAWLLNPNYGLVNAVLRVRIDWLRRPETALWTLIFIYFWKMLGYNFVFFLAGLQVIPQSLNEAAMLDGANVLQRIFRVTLPLLGPTIFFVILASVTTALQSIDLVYILTKGGPAHSTNMLIYYIYQQSFLYANWNKGYAANVILLGFLLCLTVLYFMGLERRVHYEVA